MTFATTHDEYLWLTKELFGEPGRMIKPVWDGCTPEAQESMLEQLRKPLQTARDIAMVQQAKQTTYAQMRGGDAW